MKITLAANETFSAWRERDHDDLVLAVALASWVGEQEGDGGGMVAVEVPRRPIGQGSEYSKRMRR